MTRSSIRVATVADTEELARLRWEFRIEDGTPPGLDRARFDQEMRSFVADALAEGGAWRVWVAEDGGRLVGCVWLQLVEKVPHPNRARWQRPIAYVTNMYLEPERRGAGLGRELLDVAVAFAGSKEADGVLLWPSPRSVSFYERAGFGPGGAWMWLGIAGD